MIENEVLKAIHERRSIRQFTDRQVPADMLNTVLEAGTWAPTGMGKQDPVIIAVQDKALCDEIRKLNARVMGVESDPYYGAPTIVLAFGTREWKNHVKDCSLILGTMMLAAHSIGLASCWINRCEQVFSELPESAELRRKLGVPEGYEGVGSLALGFAASHPNTVKPRKKDYFRVIS